MLDRIDKAIIRLLLKYKQKYLSTNEIAKKVQISPLTAKRHLTKLEEEGFVSFRTVGAIREYSRKKRKNG